MSTKIFAIRDSSGNFRHFNGRVAWANTAGAKASWRASVNKWRSRNEYLKWDDQNGLTIVELTEIVCMYEDLCK